MHADLYLGSRGRRVAHADVLHVHAQRPCHLKQPSGTDWPSASEELKHRPGELFSAGGTAWLERDLEDHR